jgi:hypothetical protein
VLLKRKSILALLCLIGSSAIAAPAQATFLLDFRQDGSNVLATGVGTINTTLLTRADLDPSDQGGGSVEIAKPVQLSSETASIYVGAFPAVSGTYYSLGIEPYDFAVAGFNGNAIASTGIGEPVGIYLDDLAGPWWLLDIPSGYVSGGSFSDTDTWANTTLSSLGLVEGTYFYGYGSDPTTGLFTDSFTLQIGVPEPAGLSLLVIGGATMLRRRHRSRLRR